MSQESETDNDSEDDGPELDWLPDPDKIYGKENESTNDSNSSDEESTPVEDNKR